MAAEQWLVQIRAMDVAGDDKLKKAATAPDRELVVLKVRVVAAVLFVPDAVRRRVR